MATYSPYPLEKLLSAEESLIERFSSLKRDLGLAANRIGCEQADASEPPAWTPHLLQESDMVAVTDNGPEILTPFHWGADQIELQR